MATRQYTMDSEQKEDDDFSVVSDEESLTPSEAKIEQILETRLAFDATDMGRVPGLDYEPWVTSTLRRNTSFERFDEERKLSNLAQQRIFGRTGEEGLMHLSPSATRGRSSFQRLRSSQSMERIDETSLGSPKSQAELSRKSSNLSKQLAASIKKSSSVECFKTMARDDHASSPPPPPPGSEGAAHTLGPRRHSNLALMRLIAESM